MTLKDISQKTKNKPMFMHINPIGLLRLGRTNEQRFEAFNNILNKLQNKGGNVAIPSYSYSFAKKDIYDIQNTPSDLDETSEYLRVNNNLKRTRDANFSYLLFGDGFSNRHLEVTSESYSSFGEGSLIEEVFLKDGYLAAVGGALQYLSEIHFLERKIGVNYRYDKAFSGETIDIKGNNSKQDMIYYCRDLNYNYGVSFVQLEKDLKKFWLG